MKRIVIVSIVMCFISSLYSQEICLTAFEKEVIELLNQKGQMLTENRQYLSCFDVYSK